VELLPEYIRTESPVLWEKANKRRRGVWRGREGEEK
jgi:hypothetical protein